MRQPFRCKSGILVLGLLLVLLGTGTPALFAQKPSIGLKAIAMGRDSLLVEYVTPGAEGRYPGVLLLPDRFGIQKGTRQLAVSLAEKGYRVYLLQLASCPVQAVTGFPSDTLYSSDYDLIGQVAVEAQTTPEGNGKLGLLAFDVGATLGAEMARRIPLFHGAALFYPSEPGPLTSTVSTYLFPYILVLPFQDPDYPLGRINDIREACMEQGRKLPLVRPEGTARFFFNPEHENYHKKMTVLAWAEILRVFGRSLH